MHNKYKVQCSNLGHHIKNLRDTKHSKFYRDKIRKTIFVWIKNLFNPLNVKCALVKKANKIFHWSHIEEKKIFGHIHNIVNVSCLNYYFLLGRGFKPWTLHILCIFHPNWVKLTMTTCLEYKLDKLIIERTWKKNLYLLNLRSKE